MGVAEMRGNSEGPKITGIARERARAPEEARAELQANAGLQFDPCVVEAFFRVEPAR